jgi:uncharacterized protein YcfJ
MNANKTTIVVSTIAVAVTALTAAFPASANDHRDRDFRRGERVVDTRRAPPQRFVVQRPVYQQRPQVIIRQPVIVQRPVVVERVVVHQRPAPVYYQEPAYAYAPAPGYYDQGYDQRVAYRDNDSNPAGAVAGAVIGGVIGSQVGDRDSRGVTTVIGAILGGLIGNGF